MSNPSNYGSERSGLTGSSAVPRAARVIESLNACEAIAEQLGVLAESLQQRFNAVLEPEPPDNPRVPREGRGAPISTAAPSHLATRLEELHYRLRSIGESLSSLERRAQL